MADLPTDILVWCVKVPGGTPPLSRFPFVLVFESSPDDRFLAPHAAETACRDHGLTCGSSQSGSPQALYAGASYVSKWRGLSDEERERLDGMILGGDRQCGTAAIVTVRPLHEYMKGAGG